MGFFAGYAVGNTDNVGDDTGEGLGLRFDRVRTLDRCVKFQFAFGAVAIGALIVVRLRQAQVVLTSSEIDVVVARTASNAARLGQVIGGLGCGTLTLRMASFAAADVRWEPDGRVVVQRLSVPNDLILGPGLHAGQFRTHVDLVRHDRHVDGVSGIGVDRLGLVAEDAKFHGTASAAVGSQTGVAGIAGFRLDHIANGGNGSATRNEVEHVVVVIRSEIELGQVAAAINTDGMSGAAIYARGRLYAKRVDDILPSATV